MLYLKIIHCFFFLICLSIKNIFHHIWKVYEFLKIENRILNIASLNKTLQKIQQIYWY